jgi:mannose-6-phosphate isomerase-like protein (cupin superfamily)
MLVKSEQDCPAFTANDGCRIRELMHPKNDPVELPFSLAIAEVAPGARTYRHRLGQVEVYYLLEGRGRMHIADEVRDVGAGDAVVIPSGQTQWIENNGVAVLRFAAVVSPPWRSEDDQRLD